MLAQAEDFRSASAYSASVDGCEVTAAARFKRELVGCWRRAAETRRRAIGHVNRGLTASLALFALALAACGGDETPPGTHVVGDTVFVHNQAPVFEEVASLVPVATYGEFEGDPNLEFTAVMAFDVGSNGDVVVYDSEREIKRVHRDGSFGGIIAEPGQGPGEIAFTQSVRVDEAGGVYAVDLGNGRIAYYGPDGSFESIRRPSSLPRYGEDGLLVEPDGDVWVGYHPPHVETPIEFPRPAYTRLDWERGLVDTISVPAAYGADCSLRSSRAHRNGFWEDRREPFNPKTKWARGSDGRLAFGCPADYSFDVVHPDGRVLRISREWEPIVVDDDAADFLVSVGVAPIPDTKPAYANIILPPGGRIWVWPEQPTQRVELTPEQQERWGMTERWQVSTQGAFDVFEADGTWLGKVEIPEDVRYSGYPTAPPVVIRGDTVWAVSLDELNVNYVTKYVVAWPDG